MLTLAISSSSLARSYRSTRLSMRGSSSRSCSRECHVQCAYPRPFHFTRYSYSCGAEPAADAAWLWGLAAAPADEDDDEDDDETAGAASCLPSCLLARNFSTPGFSGAIGN